MTATSPAAAQRLRDLVSQPEGGVIALALLGTAMHAMVAALAGTPPARPPTKQRLGGTRSGGVEDSGVGLAGFASWPVDQLESVRGSKWLGRRGSAGTATTTPPQAAPSG
jgi:hypothetical protein